MTAHISDEKRGALERTISEVEFLAQQIERIQTNIARMEADQSRQSAIIEVTTHKLSRMETRRLSKLQQINNILQELGVSFTFGGKVYVPHEPKIIIIENIS
jgi:hypothetical protein